MKNGWTLLLSVAFCLVTQHTLAAEAASEKVEVSSSNEQTYDENTVLNEARQFFGDASEELAKIVAKAFKEKGKPNAYIKGEEAGGALLLGVRYGDGTLYHVNGITRKVNWQGPSIGLDYGGHAAKVLILVYNLKTPDDIYNRFTGVEGSLYFVAGAGINYLKNDGVILAPIRVGVGWHQGINAGYITMTREKVWNPL